MPFLSHGGPTILVCSLAAGQTTGCWGAASVFTMATMFRSTDLWRLQIVTAGRVGWAAIAVRRGVPPRVLG